MSQLDAEPLREALLSGRHSRPEVDAFAPALAALIRDDAGAFGAWFGAGEAQALRGNPDRLRALIDRDIVAIDDLIALQLDALLHHPRFQRLEGAWRGLAWLVHGFEPGKRLKFAVLSASWRDLERDIARASEFDQSNVFRLIYEDGFGRAGGEPFGLLVIDHEISHRFETRAAMDVAPVDDVSLTSALSSIAAAAFAPIVLGASPALLGVDDFEDLVLSGDVTAVMSDDDHARWRAATAREDMRFMCVTMPRILARPRWIADPECAGGLRYDEYAPTTRERSWFVAGYAFAATVARAHVNHNWPADVRGIGTDRIGGGLVLQLPEEDFTLGAETAWPRASLSIGLTARQERALVLAGLMPLNTLPFGEAGFASVYGLQAISPTAPGRDPSAAEANRRLSAQISAILCVSRFAHYIKAIGRELTGSFSTAQDIEMRLQRWLSRYTNANPTPGPDSRARHPLVQGRVSVHDIAGRPGSYGCVIHLQPHFQLDDVSTTFRLVTGLTATGTEASPT
jgi:type VI secretion system protein ImpD/type VI secretion system protein ImpC